MLNRYTGIYNFAPVGFSFIRVYLGLSRSNVRFPGVSRTINHQELAAVIGTGFICGSILIFLGALGVLGGSIIVLLFLAVRICLIGVN